MSDLAFAIKDLCLKLSDKAFDPVAKESVKEWPEKVTAADVKKTLDLCVNGSLCSSFEILALDMLYRDLKEAEDKCTP